MQVITIPEDRPFEGFGKIPRATRGMQCVITEKVDGTNAQIVIEDSKIVAVGSRKRWISPGKSTDNFGFAGWVHQNYGELLRLGDGTHFGEWWGSGIQRGYGLQNGDKRFSLFNTSRWSGVETRPSCCGVVPVIYSGEFAKANVAWTMKMLKHKGSQVAPGYQDPEGVIIYLPKPNLLMKATFDHPDGKWVEAQLTETTGMKEAA